jgi:nascent polypeptide-associated complex subunit alpha
VIIRTPEKDLVITNPSVTKVNMMGQETYQIAGTATEREHAPQIPDEDIQTVMTQANVTREEALLALTQSGSDLAKAILALSAGKK